MLGWWAGLSASTGRGGNPCSARGLLRFCEERPEAFQGSSLEGGEQALLAQALDVVAVRRGCHLGHPQGLWGREHPARPHREIEVPSGIFEFDDDAL